MGEHSVYTLRRRVYNWTWIRRHRRRQQHARDRREPGWFRLSRPRSSSLPRRAQRWSERTTPLGRLPPREAAHDSGPAEEPQAADEAGHGQDGRGDQQELEEAGRPVRGVAL